MRRREVFAVIGSAVVWPFVARAQSTKLHRVGVLLPSTAQWDQQDAAAFREMLASFGYIEGTNLAIEIRDAAGRLDRLTDLARELVASNVDVIMAVNTPGTRAAIGATKTIPIVMGVVGDPVATGFISNLARPGGNITGVSILVGELAAKRLQLLKETVPAADRIGVLMNSADPVVEPQVRDLELAAGRLGIEVKFLDVRTVDHLEGAFKTLDAWGARAILRLAGQSLTVAPLTIELALRHKLPTMLVTKREVEAGALMSYDADRAEAYRDVARYVDRILKGANPADLPVEQPTRFELVINMKTANALGLTVPQSLLARANQLIE